MYESHFGLKRRPFAATPDPRCFLASGAMQAALDQVVVCVEQGQGVAVVSAPAGTGKTLLCERLRLELDGRFETVYLGHASFLTRRALLQTILCELNHSYHRQDEQELRLELFPAIRALSPQRDALVLICDEAHKLTEDLLEELRILSDLAEAGRPLVRLVLVGQHELEETLALPGLAALNQRIRAHVSLDTLDRAASRDYIDYRLTWAGGRTSEIFDSAALDLICHASDGVPRCINQLCDHALLLAFVADRIPVDVEIVHEALSDLRQLPLHWNEALTSESPSRTSGESQSIHATGELSGEIAPTTTSDEMLSFEFGAGTPNENLFNEADAGRAVTAIVRRPAEYDDPPANGLELEPKHENASWDIDAINSPSSVDNDEPAKQSRPDIAMETADSTVGNAASPIRHSSRGTVLEEFVWDRYAAIDAGLEPVEPEPTAAANSTPESSSHCEETGTGNVPPAVADLLANSNDVQEIENRFRAVCDRLDQLLVTDTEIPAEEATEPATATVRQNSPSCLRDNEFEDFEENETTSSAEEALGAEFCDLAHDLQDELGDRQESVCEYERLEATLQTSNDEFPSFDSDSAVEFGAETFVPQPANAGTFSTESDSRPPATTTSRPYRNLFSQLRRKQQGLI